MRMKTEGDCIFHPGCELRVSCSRKQRCKGKQRNIANGGARTIETLIGHFSGKVIRFSLSLLVNPPPLLSSFFGFVSRSRTRARVSLSVALRTTTCAAMHASLPATALVARCLLRCLFSVIDHVLSPARVSLHATNANQSHESSVTGLFFLARAL